MCEMAERSKNFLLLAARLVSGVDHRIIDYASWLYSLREKAGNR
jgi:hypothetical protein